MPPTLSALSGRFGGTTLRVRWALGLLAALHGTALVLMTETEVGLVSKTAFLLVWAGINLAAAVLWRRPIPAAICSLALLGTLILLSQFKHEKLWLTVDFVDLMIIDRDTTAFLLQALPQLRLTVAITGIFFAALLLAAWHFDPLQVRRRLALIGSAGCMGALVALSMSFPTHLAEDFSGRNYVSKFARTGVEAVDEFIERGYLEADKNRATHSRAGRLTLQPRPQVAAYHPAARRIELRHYRCAWNEGAARLFGLFPVARWPNAQARR